MVESSDAEGRDARRQLSIRSPKNDEDSPTRGPSSSSVEPRESAFVMDDREKKLAIFVERRLEQRITRINRQESGDSYAGLPADHVLQNLHQAFPDVNFPERMLSRLEREQEARIERERREDELELYQAETRRLDAVEDRKHLTQAARRAVGVLILMLAVGLVLIFTGRDDAGLWLVGSTMVAIVVGFLRQQFRPTPES